MDWLIPPEQIRDAYSKVPRPLREFIVEGELARITQKIAQEHKLHVDTSGLLSQLLTLVLLGFLDPSVLPKELEKLGIPPEDIPDFIKELNVEVFMPLQKKVREGGQESSKDERIREGITEQLSVPAPSPAAFRTVAPPPEVLPLAVGSQTHTAMSASVPGNEAPSINLIRSSVITPQPQPQPIAPVPTMRTMQHDMDLVQHGVQPSPYVPNGISVTPHPSHLTPARSFQTASVPVTAMPAPAQPTTIFSGPKPQMAPSRPVPGNEYTSDPYRESI